MELRILGPLEVRVGERVLPLSGARQRTVLALLLLRAGEVVSSDRLIDELWGERPPPSALDTLQVYVSRLRKVLPEGTVVTEGRGYRLAVAGEQIDAGRFERLAGEGRAALAEGDPERSARLLREALDLWRGPALADFAYAPFAQGEIARLEELRVLALEERLEADLASGRAAELVGELEALVGAHPLRERLRGQLMRALYRSGRQAEALRGISGRPTHAWPTSWASSRALRCATSSARYSPRTRRWTPRRLRPPRRPRHRRCHEDRA